MQIVIDIDEAIYNRFVAGFADEGDAGLIETMFNQGIVLPKGHGRLIDISKIDDDMMEKDNPIIYLTINGQYTEAISLDYLNDLPTIIEADTESRGKE